MLSFIRNEKALTLIEVLVAVILTAIVMLHGTIFFIATWRLNAESKEYSLILNDVVGNLENYIERQYNDDVNITSDQYMIKDRLLRNKYNVTYSIVKNTVTYEHFGFYYVISSARWRYGGDERSDNKINIKTVCAKEWNKQQ
ncbi:MAG: prepilin-type N-terminal cleavage/methylation domain-containing protein [Elusimicrobia bacterium]|nr:prepilin-type N-terminal cleavage/methylation domain-containing protein [Elusimicrobiota bacterium]